MNIFETASEFIEMDNRTERVMNRVTAESTYNRLSVQLPTWLVKDKTVVDLGSCLGAAGHMVLTNGAKHYTGVELQQKYVTDSNTIMSKYWDKSKFNIIQNDIESYLDNCIVNNIKFDVVIASGVLYAFLDIVKILEKISLISTNSILIDTMYVKEGPKGIILIRDDSTMVYAEGAKTFTGIGSTCNLTALDIIMKTTGFYRTEDKIIPPVTVGSHDGYSDLFDAGGGHRAPSRYAARYYKKDIKVKRLIDTVLENNEKDASAFYQEPTIKEAAKDTIWKFDDTVASRFQFEAETNIPDYARVIDLCLEVANNYIKKDDAVIDVGSALGYTVDKFLKNDFKNTIGLDNSDAMYAKSLHQEKIIVSDQLPDQQFKLVLINWTLHFIINKYEYLTDVFNKLEPGGFLILSDKTTQTEETKKMYYDFKRSNGITDEYIFAKEKKLKGYMYTVPATWYNSELEKIGFESVEVINAKLGFVTWLCKKPNSISALA